MLGPEDARSFKETGRAWYTLWIGTSQGPWSVGLSSAAVTCTGRGTGWVDPGCLGWWLGGRRAPKYWLLNGEKKKKST